MVMEALGFTDSNLILPVQINGGVTKYMRPALILSRCPGDRDKVVCGGV